MCHIIKQLMTFNSIDTRFINPKIIYLPWPLVYVENICISKRGDLGP